MKGIGENIIGPTFKNESFLVLNRTFVGTSILEMLNNLDELSQTNDDQAQGNHLDWAFFLYNQRHKSCDTGTLS